MILLYFINEYLVY